MQEKILRALLIAWKFPEMKMSAARSRFVSIRCDYHLTLQLSHVIIIIT